MQDTSKKYDVVIIGAGPGGLACALELSKHNKRVLLLEKNEKIGPKICAGGLPVKCMKLLDLPTSVSCRKFKTLKYETESHERIVDYGSDFIQIIDREELGQLQLSQIKSPNVEIRTNAKVTLIEKSSFKINGEENVEFDFLVGADGSNSIVRKFLKIPTKKIIVAFQYMLKKDFDHVLCYRNSKLFKIWYAWIFPQGKFSTIGFCCVPGIIDMNTARKNFDSWLKKKDIDVTDGEFQAFPINCDYRGYRFENIFLVGDAAGFSSILTGEGIYQGLISGREVAKEIIDRKYKSKKIRKLLRKKTIHNAAFIVLKFMGPLRESVYFTLAFFVKSKRMSKFILDFLG